MQANHRNRFDKLPMIQLQTYFSILRGKKHMNDTSNFKEACQKPQTTKAPGISNLT